jgi:hypothetical protein
MSPFNTLPTVSLDLYKELNPDGYFINWSGNSNDIIIAVRNIACVRTQTKLDLIIR